MNPARLDKRVTIEVATETRDEFGDPVKSWGPFATVWASIEALVGREAMVARQVEAELPHRVRLRYLAGLTLKMRIRYAARYFDIQSIADADEGKAELELMCLERVGGVSG